VSPAAYRLLFWLGFFLLLILILGQIQGILIPFAAGLMIAYVLAPLVAHLEARGVRRTLASVIVVALSLLGLGLLLVILVPLVQGQIVQLITSAPNLVRALQDHLGKLIQLLQEHLPAEDVSKVRDVLSAKLGEAVTWIASLLQGVITSSLAILNIVSLVIVTPIVTFFLLRDWEIMVAQIDSYLPRQSLETVRGQARLVSDTLVGFVHGQALVCLILGTYYGIALSLAGLASGLALGLLIGVLAIIPVLGVTVGFALAVGLAATQYGSWSAILIVCGIFAAGQLTEANFLTPKLVGDRIHLHPVWVIFALFAGGTLLGFVGVLIAVPAAAVIGVLARFALQRYRASSLYDARQTRPDAPQAMPAIGPPADPPDAAKNETVANFNRIR
jgi:predicted PurR-regulated permease PerM